MSDLMFYGVLRMPYDLAMGDEMARRQFYSRAQEAADRVEAAEQLAAEREVRNTLQYAELVAANGCIAEMEAQLAAASSEKAELKEMAKLHFDACEAEIARHRVTVEKLAAADAHIAVLTAKADNGRAAGRAEAMALLVELDPESGIDDFIGWSTPVGPEDEGSAFWDRDKLRELFSTDTALADMMDKAEGEYYEYQGYKEEAKHANAFALNMHSSGKIRDALSRAGEHGLMAELCWPVDADARTLKAVEAMQWQPIETAPKDGRTVLLGAPNELGNWRTMRGQWYSQSAIDDEWEDPDGCVEGWFETAVEPDAPNCWLIAPTHWMPLPKAPE